MLTPTSQQQRVVEAVVAAKLSPPTSAKMATERLIPNRVVESGCHRQVVASCCNRQIVESGGHREYPRSIARIAVVTAKVRREMPIELI